METGRPETVEVAGKCRFAPQLFGGGIFGTSDDGSRVGEDGLGGVLCRPSGGESGCLDGYCGG
jgi:hypothetical protein